MKDLNTESSLLKPDLLKEKENIQAWFTLKNKEFGVGNQAIPGLNLGFNTAEQKGIVTENRRVLYDHLGLDEQWIASAEQVHSNNVQFVTQGGNYPATDGLLTVVPGLTLVIQVADCAAVLLWDSQNKVIGALHAGWRGAAGDIVPAGLEKMGKQGADHRNLKAFISPCISLKNFEVGEEVACQFPNRFVDYEHFAKPHVDLKGFLAHQLREGGLVEKNIEISEGCTMEGITSFYSYRREEEQSGRMMALIRITE